MKKTAYFFIVTILAASNLYGQQNTESDIKVIRELYQKAQEFIQHDKEDPAIEYQLTLSLRRHHTVEGHVTYDYNFYFDWKNDKKGSLAPRLKFVRVKIADRGGISNEEYLFNDKEELVFCFSKFKDFENNNDVEIRLYYKDSRRIRNLAKMTALGSKKVTDYTTIPEDYQMNVEHTPKEAERVKSMFKLAMNQSGDVLEDMSMNEAADILRKQLNDQTMKYLLGEDAEAEVVDGENTYYIRAYHESSDGESIATFGHFYIGRQSGKIYMSDLVNGGIIPYKPQ